MNEFVLVLMIYANSPGGQMQMMPLGDAYATQAECEKYKEQALRDFKEPNRTLRASCLPRSSMSQYKGGK